MSSASRSARVGAPAPDAELFTDAMAGLASGVAVVTAARAGGQPCGLTATSISAYSSDPPSVLVSIGHGSRCHSAVVAGGECFAVHLLRSTQEDVARVFASRSDDKFAGLEWYWDGEVPRIEGVLVYLRCRRAAVFERYDHSILVGDADGGFAEDGDPLVYMARRMDWRLSGPV
jgi:flavin reductase (DIM6/NTAB) family NADH-FMN oxidoreductase RutF